MSQSPNYALLILAFNVCLAIAEVIRRTFNAWSRFHSGHNEATETALSDQREWGMVAMIVNLLDYIDRERQSNPRAQIKDLLQYGQSDYAVRLLEPHLQMRESLGEDRKRLEFRSSIAKSSALFSVVVLTVLVVDVLIAFVILAFGATVDSWTWYVMATIAAVAGTAGISGLLVMHVMETRFSVHLAAMRSARVRQSMMPVAIRDDKNA